MAELVVALDVGSAAAAERLLDAIPAARWVKVGSVLMGREGPALLARLRSRGLSIFLDLKWHDIPHTVAGAVERAAEMGVAMATVHVLGGRAMLKAAAEVAARAGGPGLVGVTVLTSHDAAGYGEAIGTRMAGLDTEVVRLARLGMDAGLRGLVCSPREVAGVRRELGAVPWLVVPGIRGPADDPGDQVRTASAADARRAGATHLVVGRPILRADDPGAAFRKLAEG